MKKTLFLKTTSWLVSLSLIFGFILLTNLGTAKAETKYPKPIGAVNDFAGIISADYKRNMESLANELLQKTGTSIVVATVESVGDTDYSIYANELYRAWGIGKEGEDKGVLIFLTLKERKLRIETGYGVEGILPDGLVGQIMDDYMLPYLRKNDYGKGIFNGFAVLALTIAKNAGVTLEGKGTIKKPTVKKRNSALGFIPILFFIVLFLILSRSRGGGILPLLLLMMMGGRGGGFGGGFGGFGGGFGGFGGGMSGGGGAGRSF